MFRSFFDDLHNFAVGDFFFNALEKCLELWLILNPSKHCKLYKSKPVFEHFLTVKDALVFHGLKVDSLDKLAIWDIKQLKSP